MLLINQIKLPVGYSQRDLVTACEKALHKKQIPEIKILRRSLDARRREGIHYQISAGVLGFRAEEEKRILRSIHNKNVMLTKQQKYSFPYSFSKVESGQADYLRPVIVGTGPAGYFAGLLLAEAGFRPILIERGKAVEERKADVDAFWGGGRLDPDSNVSFGEGGAGTFSDGKLNTGNKDREGLQAFVLETFTRFGAGEEITYDAKPHVGTDVLYRVMQRIRHRIEEKGGEILFSHQLTGIENPFAGEAPGASTGYGTEASGIPRYRLTIKRLCKQEVDFLHLDTSLLILAIGHSARDTFRMLYDFGLSMEKKPFAMGLRIEHPQSLINRARYGEDAPLDKLPAADYKLVYHTGDGRSVFSFCMCPGGYVVNASTEEGGTVVNGMSYSGRHGENANSAIVVNVLPEDIPGEDPMAAIAYQREMEQGFFRLGEGNIPVQRFEDFCRNEKTSVAGQVTPQIKGKYVFANLRDGLPEEVSRAIIEAVMSCDGSIPGFALPDALLSGLESRTSSPVRMIRDEGRQALRFPGIFPCGEGAGYAGGIMSAAVDGIHVAENAAAYLLGLSQ